MNVALGCSLGLTSLPETNHSYLIPLTFAGALNQLILGRGYSQSYGTCSHTYHLIPVVHDLTLTGGWLSPQPFTELPLHIPLMRGFSILSEAYTTVQGLVKPTRRIR